MAYYEHIMRICMQEHQNGSSEKRKR